MPTLNNDLQKITDKWKETTPIEAWNILENSIKEIQSLGIANGPSIGNKVKDFTLKNAEGEIVNLYEELSKGPVILTFYRGSWCPYCNRQLRAYEEIINEIKQIGASLIAISPQTPDNSLTIQEKHNLSYHVLSDTKGLTAAKYNILFDVPNDVKDVYENIGLDLADYNGPNNWMLPVPSTFMIDETGTIRFSYVNPNYMERLEPDELLEALKTL
ncbi:peroxiredoxin-like family protein [Bacillus solimangrovi]|nr:peroxiredoxin-like family protein [Bacillus solimangrovi]